MPTTGEGIFLHQDAAAAPADPYIYKSVGACQIHEPGSFTLCSVEIQACTSGEDGRAVDWYRSLKPPAAPAWSFLSGPVCIYTEDEEEPVDVLALIAAQISHAFQNSPITPASIGSQPGPHTLRGQETNFYADAATQDFNITLLGQNIHITATPVSYTWTYGDGTTLGPTTSPGAPLPQDRIGEQTQTSHSYTTTGKKSITVTTHFNGTYSVNTGPAIPIPAQGHFTSPPLPLTVWRAVTRNYADDCNTNPNGQGC